MSSSNLLTAAISSDVEGIAQILIEKCGSILVSDARECIGCRACIKACKKKGGSLLANHWVECGTVKIAPACRTCESPRCLVACKKNAIRKENGRVLIDEKTCVKCGLCVRVCPFGLIHVAVTGESGATSSSSRCEPGKPAAGRLPKEISKCDQCADRGSPACVRECPTGSLRFIDHEKFQALMETQRVRMREITDGHERPMPGEEAAGNPINLSLGAGCGRY